MVIETVKGITELQGAIDATCAGGTPAVPNAGKMPAVLNAGKMPAVSNAGKMPAVPDEDMDASAT